MEIVPQNEGINGIEDVCGRHVAELENFPGSREQNRSLLTTAGLPEYLANNA